MDPKEGEMQANAVRKMGLVELSRCLCSDPKPSLAPSFPNTW
jgi:hypothetical protein